jgi:hypothetical protein
MRNPLWCRRSFRMWSTVVCANPVSRASSRIVWRRSVSSNAERAYTSSSLTLGRPGRRMLPHFGVPVWRLSPTLPLFCKAMQIARKPLADLDDNDTVVLYGLWRIQSLSNSAVPVSKTSRRHDIRPPATGPSTLVTEHRTGQCGQHPEQNIVTKLVRCSVRGLFGGMSVFARRIKETFGYGLNKCGRCAEHKHVTSTLLAPHTHLMIFIWRCTLFLTL